MGEKSRPLYVNRCLNCGFKTHKGLWKEGKTCPICEESEGFSGSKHGGLTTNQIEKARKLFKNNLEKNLIGTRGKERLN